jgi:hypothetical protein
MPRNTTQPMFRALIIACAVTLLSAPAGMRVASAAEPPKEWDGLELRPSSSVDRLYVRPGASLAGYKRIRLEPLQVAFDKNWDPNRGSAGVNRLTAQDFEKIKKALAEEFAKVCAQELAKGGYVLVKEPGDDVLDVQPFVVDLYIAAPQKQTAGRSTTYTSDAGHMTLVAELRDSDTNQILARVVDQRNASQSGTYQLTTSVSNMGAARQIIARWASALRKALDTANGKS